MGYHLYSQKWGAGAGFRDRVFMFQGSSMEKKMQLLV